jgi:hypothetical protein
VSEKKGCENKPIPPIPTTQPLQNHPAFGMWKDREDMKDPAAYIRKIRQPRYTWDDVLGVVRTER